MKKLNHQIIKFNGKNQLMEVLANCFSIGKVQIHFHKYDESKEKGQRVTSSVDIYTDIEEMLLLCNDILTGRISKELEVSKAKGKYPEPVWIDMGGVSANKLEERAKYCAAHGIKPKESQHPRDDGKSLSRVLKIVPGDKFPVLFVAESGAGEEAENGLIVPKYGRNPDNRIMFGLTNDQLKKLAISTKMNIEAYYAAQYVSGAFLKEFV